MTIEEAINNYADKKIDDLINSLTDADKVATGKLTQSLRYVVESNPDQMKFIISFFGEHYAHNIAGGRLPGTYPNIDNIKLWMKARKIPENKLFAIVKKIYDDGITQDFTIQQAISEEYYTDFGGILQDSAIEDFKKQIDDIIKEINSFKTI